jgi:hypothetical protein
MTQIYTAQNDIIQLTIDDRLQGWQIHVSRWDGDYFVTLFDRYMIYENLREAVTDALGVAVCDWDEAEAIADDWGIFAPDLDEENN